MLESSIESPIFNPLAEDLSDRAHASAGTLDVILFSSTLFCGSALLFLIEPMFARMVLPLLGGSPSVWNTCMVCFQALLLAGYAYGHWSIRSLSFRRHVAVHLALLAIPLALLPLTVPRGWTPPVQSNPIGWLMALILVAVGLPFFVVSSTGPVIQRWFSATGHRAGGDPYFLYAASNLGSMLALIAYPTIVEPFIHLAAQSRLWTDGYALLIVLIAACALRLKTDFTTPAISAKPQSIALFRRLRWILLAMIPSSLLLGTTTFITSDIAAVPLFWIAPLALYLLSFIFVFARRRIIAPETMVRALPILVLAVALFMLGRVGQPVWMVLPLHLATLFAACMVCHGRLADDRPSVASLTDFYLTLSLGGVLGGLFNGLLAPMIFHSAAEYPIALVLACAMCVRPANEPGRPRPGPHRAMLTTILNILWPLTIAALAFFLPRFIPARDSSLRILAVGIPVILAVPALKHRWRFAAVLVALFLAVPVGAGNGKLLLARRSFFGIHRVVQNPDGPFNDLFHGTTIHGKQWLAGPDLTPARPQVALTYYHATGPIGQIITTTAPRRIAVVGLGVGSLAAYADAQTTLVFYEIDPTVRWIAADSGYFTFIQSARQRGANVRIVLGDARLTLSSAPANSYDLLVIDAFSGDAVPIHLLTREAMAIYRDRLAPGGLLAMHISNMYLDLKPVIAALANDGGWTGLSCDDLELSPSQAAAGKFASQWIVLSRDPSALAKFRNDPRWHPLQSEPGVPVWSDDFSNILSVFRWK